MKTQKLLFAIGFIVVGVSLAQDTYADRRTGFSRDEIKSMPIEQRPQRIGHFYGRFYRYFNSGRPLFPGPSVFGTSELQSAPSAAEQNSAEQK